MTATPGSADASADAYEDDTIVPRIHSNGLLICMEGPQFSTRGESNLYRSWGASVINMSCLPEAKLAREAEMSYAMICMSTDYDCWKDEDVSVEMVMGNMKANADNARRVCDAVLDVLGKADDVTAEDSQPVAAIRKLAHGEGWKGQSLRGLSGLSAIPEVRQEITSNLQWLFEDWKG